MNIKKISDQILFFMNNTGLSFEDVWKDHVSDEIKEAFPSETVKKEIASKA